MLVRYLEIFVICLFSGLLLSACEPPWPQCKKDRDCHSKRQGNQTGRTIFCIQKQCQECRTIKDCPQQKLHKCQGYRCIKKTCADIICKGIKRCDPATLSCQWICQKNGESPCDGDRCKRCNDHQCIYRQPECLTSADCPEDQVCKDANTCIARCALGCDRLKCKHPYECYHGKCLELCKFQNVMFKKNQFTLAPKEQKKLMGLVPCLQLRRTKKLLIKVHYTEGKTREFDIHKSLKRARFITKFLQTHKINRNQLCPIPMGKENPLFWNKPTKKEQTQNHQATFELANQCP